MLIIGNTVLLTAVVLSVTVVRTILGFTETVTFLSLLISLRFCCYRVLCFYDLLCFTDNAVTQRKSGGRCHAPTRVRKLFSPKNPHLYSTPHSYSLINTNVRQTSSTHRLVVNGFFCFIGFTLSCM